MLCAVRRSLQLHIIMCCAIYSGSYRCTVCFKTMYPLISLNFYKISYCPREYFSRNNFFFMVNKKQYEKSELAIWYSLLGKCVKIFFCKSTKLIEPKLNDDWIIKRPCVGNTCPCLPPDFCPNRKKLLSVSLF